MLVAVLAAATAAATSFIPIAEYEPVHAVLFSEELFTAGYHASELVTAVQAAGAEALIVAAEARTPAAQQQTLATAGKKPVKARFLTVPHGNIWLRDYGPIPVRDRATGTPRFLDFKYDDLGEGNDAFPSVLGGALGVTTTTLSTTLDGGNLIVAGDICITSLSPDNGELAPAARTALGCREVITLRDPPHAHVDMWIKAVAKDTLLVNELNAETLAVATGKDGLLPADIERMRDQLEAGARTLAKHFKVERLPMPLPYRGVFRTFANSLLVNRRAITPSFKRWGWGHDDYPDAPLESAYESKVRAIYARHGYQTVFVPADGLIYNGGGFHCVLLQLPSGVTLSAAPEARKKKG